jgi:hypothetical protein
MSNLHVDVKRAGQQTATALPLRVERPGQKLRRALFLLAYEAQFCRFPKAVNEYE